MTDVSEPRVLVRAYGGLGHLTLNRPRAINALDLDMIGDLAQALDAWENNTDVDVVLLDGAGDRGLCAGGDVRSLAQQIADGRAEDTGVFFRAEYALNARIAEYPAPVVAIADGVTMGGGIGLAGHAAIRIVTERSKLAMPETRIGFTPDVGGTWLLAHAPGRLGEYLGLTGAVMNASDAIYAGFADHYIPAERLEALRDALETRADPSSPTELVLLFDETPEPSRLREARAWIDDAFAADTVAEIVERLHARPEAEAAATAEVLGELAPTALAVNTLVIMPALVPETILGVGLLLLMKWAHQPRSYLLLVLGHIMLALPFVVLVVQARLIGVKRVYEEASLSLGANRFNTFREVTLPLLMPAIVASVLLVFTISFDNITASLFWRPPGVETMPTQILAMLKISISPEINALGTLMILITVGLPLAGGLLGRILFGNRA